MVGYQIIIIIRKATSCHIGDSSRYETKNVCKGNALKDHSSLTDKGSIIILYPIPLTNTPTYYHLPILPSIRLSLLYPTNRILLTLISAYSVY